MMVAINLQINFQCFHNLYMGYQILWEENPIKVHHYLRGNLSSQGASWFSSYSHIAKRLGKLHILSKETHRFVIIFNHSKKKKINIREKAYRNNMKDQWAYYFGHMF